MSILHQIRSSCNTVRSNPGCCVKVDRSAIDSFLASFTEQDFRALSDHTKLPLRFDTLDQEINFVAVLSLLNFGHGYRRELHAAAGRGAWESIIFGAISMHISGAKLDAAFFTALSLSDVAGYFGLPLHVEKPHESMAGVYIQTASPLAPLIGLIQSALVDTGKRLLQMGYKKLSDFILDTLKGQSPPTASALVGRLVSCFPAFDDHAEFNGIDVYFCKKAQFLASELYSRFAVSHPAQFAFSDIADLTVFVDNVVPAVLQRLGILVLPRELASAIERSDDLILTHQESSAKQLLAKGAGDEAPQAPLSTLHPSSTPTIARADVQLRAVAVSACEDIVRLARQSLPWAAALTAKELDYYLWRLGKEGDFRKVVRHRVQTTYYY